MFHFVLNNRKSVASVVIIAGIAISVFIIGTSSGENDGNRTFINNQAENSPSFQFKSDTSALKTIKVSVVQKSDEQDYSNLTESIIQLYSSNLFTGDQAPMLTEESLEQILKEAITQPLEYPKSEMGDIVISSNNSTTSQVTYIESADGLLWKNFSEFENETIITAIDDFLNKNNPRLIDYIINAIPQHINDLLELEVPSSWQELHLQTLNLWQEKLVFYQSIRNVQSDPLKAYISLQRTINIIQKDLDLQLITIRTYEKLTINNN